MKINEIINEDFKIDTSRASKIDLNRAISRLNPQQQMAVKMRFTHDMTLEQIAKEMGITRERVRQILLKVLRILRHPSNGILEPEELDAVRDKLIKIDQDRVDARNKKYQTETTTAGSVATSMGGGNGFVNGGPGTLSRAGTVPKKKKTNKKKR